MAHSKSKNWIHLVITTKHRQALIHPSAAPKIHQLLRTRLIEAKCYVRAVNGMPDHVHLLFLLNPQKALSAVVQQLKGGSSCLINQSNWLPYRFSWGTGYGAFSVSESGVERVNNYILNQQRHHTKRDFDAEWEMLLRVHELE